MSSNKAKSKLSHLDDYLTHHAQTNPSKLALVCDDRQFTWEELEAEAEILAAQIVLKIGQEHTNQVLVGLLMPNTWQYVLTYLAILKTGHIALPIDVSYKALEIEAILDQLSPKLLIGDKNSPTALAGRRDFISYESLRSSKAATSYTTLRLSSNTQIASLLFTSGTTGHPKAVPNTHSNQLWNIKTCSKVWEWTGEDTLLISLRLSHMYGLVVGLTGSVYHGNTLYLQDWFDPKKTLEALSSGKISIFKHVPLAYQELLDYASTQVGKSYNLSKVRLFTSGGGPLPPDIWQAFKDRFGVEIIETYGTSETGRIAGNHLDSPLVGSPGYLLPGVEAKLSAMSELLIKSGGVFPGYYKNQTATKAGFTTDGWWKTGDIAEIIDGRVFLKGRVQEKIRKSGYTVSPRDVEWALLKHAAIKEVYVMGHQLPGQPSDELIFFLVGNISDAELANYCKQNLLFAWRPDKIVRLDRLPRTSSGKIKIPDLKKLVV